jgi:crotonobetainyl-CoA:carnitine CoA-transferase CaiB-like acyl-CoA transferase
MDKLGVGYAVIAALNPRIAYCSISGYGQDGPYKDLAGHDINYLGYAGVLDQIGSEGGNPAIPEFPDRRPARWGADRRDGHPGGGRSKRSAPARGVTSMCR